MYRALSMILAGILATTPADAHGPEGHGGDAYSLPSTPIPATLAGVVASMRAQHAVAGTALKSSKGDQVLASAQALWDLAAAAPARGATLAADARTTIAAKSLDIQQQTNALFSKLVRGDQPGAEAALAAISADIDALAVLAK